MSHPVAQINLTSFQIVSGEYDKAIVSLTSTLKTLKLVLSGDAKILIPDEMNGNDGDCYMNVHDSSSSSGSFEYDFFSKPTSSSFIKITATVRDRHDNSTDEPGIEYIGCNCVASYNISHQKLQTSIFREPIIVRGDQFRAPLDVHLCEELTYVAIYNLALSHHLKSLELSSAPKRNLRRVYLYKALSLYEHSHQILMKQTINVGVPVIHSMALVSNLGQIHHALGDHQKAEMCMQYLLSTMMYVIDCGKVDSLGNSMDGFFDIIMPLVSTDEPAPAA